MKKYIIIICLIMAVIGCSREKKELISNETLKETIIKYGREVYESESFKNKEPSENIYTMNLKTLDKINKDITIFLKRNCNVDNTRVELRIVATNNDIKFYYSPILDCK